MFKTFRKGMNKINFSVLTSQFQKNMSIAEVCCGSFSSEITTVLKAAIKLVFEDKMGGDIKFQVCGGPLTVALVMFPTCVRPWKGNDTVCCLEQSFSMEKILTFRTFSNVWTCLVVRTGEY